MSEESKCYKIKIEGELIVYCEEDEIESMVYHDLIENMEIIIKIKDKKEITEEEADNWRRD